MVPLLAMANVTRTTIHGNIPLILFAMFPYTRSTILSLKIASRASDVPAPASVPPSAEHAAADAW
jgi:hypothetical protein